MMHPNVYVAQTTAAHMNHFYRVCMEANEYEGPALISVFTTCQPEHGVGDHEAAQRAKMAVESRAFPLLVYDPRKGETVRERLDLKGNPNMNEDWALDVKTKQPITFVDFARGEGRFVKHFDKQGNPSEMLMGANKDRLSNWRLLQDLAGIRKEAAKPAATAAKAPTAGATPAAAAPVTGSGADRIAQAKAMAAAKAGKPAPAAEAPVAAAPAPVVAESAPAAQPGAVIAGSKGADRVAQAKALAAKKKAEAEGNA
jgi:hypothetical protein